MKTEILKRQSGTSRVLHSEILVIGAGPGGSAAAWALARAGRAVMLIDRAAFPRDKTCGDGLTPNAVRTLRQMGVLTQVERAGAQRIDCVSITGPGGMATCLSLADHMPPDVSYALVLSRFQLDDILRRHALASGAQFKGQVHVTHLQHDKDRITAVLADTPSGSVTFRAEHVVMAVGANVGLLRREGWLSPEPQVLRAARAYYQAPGGPQHSYCFYFDRELLPGYGWIFPTGDGVANVGVGILPDPDGPRPSTANLLEEFIRLRIERGDLQAAVPVGPVKSYPLRLDFLKQPVAGANWLLVGEAAGLVNPLTGEGIDLALESGLLAARLLHADICEGRSHHLGYQQALWRQYGPMFQGLSALRDVMVRPVLADYVLWLTRQHRFLAKTVLRVALGIDLPAAVFHPLFMLQLLLPVSPRFMAQQITRMKPGYQRADSGASLGQPLCGC